MHKISKKMDAKGKKTFYHIEALLTSVVWGTTFVSSKILIVHGLLPSQIMFLRFCMAYLCIVFLSEKKFLSQSWKDELLFLCLGLTGGSLYFLAENTALVYTQASNVSILISTTPMLTAIAMAICYKSERFGKVFLLGAVIAFVGIVMVVLNGHFVLKLSPLGDILTLSASAIWVFYGLILKRIQRKGYSSIFITRKVFFYGIITIIPFLPFDRPIFTWQMMTNVPIMTNLIFLGIVASFIGYLAWNHAIDKIGVVGTTNYLYLNPLATFITSAIVLHEQITLISIVGGILILGGVYLSQKHPRHKSLERG